MINECEKNVCVPYVPSPVEDVMQVLKKLNPRRGEVILEPGCADATNLKEAYNRFGLIGIGIELDEGRYNRAIENVRGLPITIIYKSFADSKDEIASADYIYCYLLRSVNNEVIKPLVERYAKPGAWIISRHFTFEGWSPVFVERRIYVYRKSPRRNIIQRILEEWKR